MLFRSVDIRLERGAEPGYVMLVVDVRERNTVVIEQLVAGLSKGVASTTDRGREIFPWLGFKVTETNLAGLGIRLSGTALLSEFQQGGRIAIGAPGSGTHVPTRFGANLFALRSHRELLVERLRKLKKNLTGPRPPVVLFRRIL